MFGLQSCIKAKACMFTQLPHLQNASISVSRIRDYVLNSQHPLGQHKARVFKSALGIEQIHAEELSRIILASLPRSPGTRKTADSFGERWITYHEIVGLNGETAIVSVAWIFRPTAPNIPELLSCFIDTEGQEALKKEHSSQSK